MTTRVAGTTAHLPPMRTRTGSGRPMPIKPFRHFLVQKNMDRRLGGKNNIQPTPRHNKDLPGSLSGLSMNKSSTKSRARVVPRAAHHSYAEWCKERGVDAPNVSIHYLSSSLPDGAETERGCLVTEPIEPGQVIARCPASIVFALPPSPPNPFPKWCPNKLWDEPPGVAPGRPAQELRMALALIKEKRSGAKSPWAAYIAQLPNEYDLLGMWTDDQLVELHSPKLELEAKRQRSENAAAASAVCKPLKITPKDMYWGLNTVRSRSFLGKYPADLEHMMPPYAPGTAANKTLAKAKKNAKLAAESEDAKLAKLATKAASTECGLAPDDPDGTAVPSCTPMGDTSRRSKTQPAVFVVPFLDAFNHRSNSDLSSGGESPGADSSMGADGSHTTKLHFTDGAFELVADRSLAPGDEATISYGSHANDELLLRFGFCVSESVDDTIPLPGCMDELEWLMPGTTREADLRAEGLDDAVRTAHLTTEGEASPDLLWALRSLLASDDEYDALGGALGMNKTFTGIDEVGSGAQLAAEASLALACERELTTMGGLAAYDEDVLNLAAVENVYDEVIAECSLDGGDVDRCGGDGEDGNDTTYLRRLRSALVFRMNRKRILAKAMERYTPGGFGYQEEEEELNYGYPSRPW